MGNKVYTENELRALELLVLEGGVCAGVAHPRLQRRRSCLQNSYACHTVYRKLERLGLVFYSEEDPLDMPGDPLDGFTFTREIYITDTGRSVLSAK